MTAPEDRIYCGDPWCDGDHRTSAQTCAPEGDADCCQAATTSPEPGVHSFDCPNDLPEVPC